MPCHVSLYELVGLAFIMKAATGVIYSNQTGGTGCLQPQIEGALVPFRNDVLVPGMRLISPEHELCDYFEGPPHCRTGATSGLSVADADTIDRILDRCKAPWARVDRRRLGDSHEAWVHMLVMPEPAGTLAPLFSGFEPYPAGAVLTWQNSD